jgi:hypothetical protein
MPRGGTTEDENGTFSFVPLDKGGRRVWCGTGSAADVEAGRDAGAPGIFLGVQNWREEELREDGRNQRSG